MPWQINQQGWLAQARSLSSPNHDQRPAHMPIDLLVIHYISLPPGQFKKTYVEDFFLNRLDRTAHPYFEALEGVKVSAHFYIRRSGEVIQFVSTSDRAWHAGVSSFTDQQGVARERCNDFSVGVELEGDAEHAFTARQYRRLASLTRAVVKRHSIAAVCGHSDIAPGRKADPGPMFDWARYLDLVRTCGLQAKTPR